MTGENIESTFNCFINQVMLKKLARDDPVYLAKILAENIPFMEDEHGREARFDNSFLEDFQRELETE